MRMKTYFVPFVVALVVGSVTTNTGAATFNVNDTADTPDANPGTGGCADASSKCTLRAAIMEANANGVSDTIVLDADTYVLTIAPVNPDTDAVGDLDITDDVEILGSASPSLSRISGDDGALGDRILEVSSGAVVEIEDVVIEGGDSSVGGGGIEVTGASSLDLLGCHVSNNRGDGPGGILVSGNSSLSLELVTMEDNVSDGFLNAGGITCALGSALDILDSTIQSNAGQLTGGVATYCVTTLTSSTINENQATSGFATGGGILVRPGGDLTAVNSTISGNTSGMNGGGIYVAAPFIYISEATLNNTTVAFNHASGDGGGVYVAHSSGGLSAENSILADNTDTGSNAPDCGGVDFESLGYNFISDTTGCTITGTTTGNLLNADAKLDPVLRDNGGPTQTHALLPNGGPIEGGNDSTCETTDQRGVSRPIPISGDCDMGSFEAPECGNGVLEVPESCDDNNTADLDGCSSDCVSEPLPSGHNEPRTTGVMQGGLVVAYEDCLAGSGTHATFNSVSDACMPKRMDPDCGFQNTTGTVGSYTIDSVATGAGRIKIDAQLTKLDTTNCAGDTLRISATVTITAEDCSDGNGTSPHGSCTIEMPATLKNATCVVSGTGGCTINAELNPTDTTPRVLETLRTGIQVRDLKIERDTGSGWVTSFVPGVYHP
jgi:CSLREA domain-containing protein